LIPKAYTGNYGLVSVAAATGALPIFNTTDTYGAAKGSGTRTDANSSSIVLAVPMDGTNGGTSFSDQSAVIKGSGSAKAITVNSATTSTSQSKFYGSSGSFNGSSASLSLADSADWAFGSGAFTIETWAYLNSGSLYFGQGDGSSPAFIVYGNTVYLGPSVWTDSFTFTTPPTGRWFHFALVRNGSTLTVYIDGAFSGSLSYSSTWPDSSDLLTIGQTRSVYTNGYFQDFRIYKGVAKYTSNFSPVVSYNNSFYLKFDDNSSNTASTLGKDSSPNGNNWTPNNFSVTDAAPVTVAAATGALPILNTTDTYGATLGSGVRSDAFASSLQLCIPGGTSSGINLTDQNPTGRVSPLRNITNGGSLTGTTASSKYYGGALSMPAGATGSYSADVWASIGSGPFTVEFWIYLISPTMNSGYASSIINGRRDYGGIITVGSVFAGVSGAPCVSFQVYTQTSNTAYHYVTDNGLAGSFPVAQWVHCAQTRDSSGVVRTFKNGVKVIEQSGVTGEIVGSIAEFGGWTSGYGDLKSCYISDMRVYNTAKYTSSFSIPVSPQQIAPGNAGNDSLVDSPTNYGTDTGVGGEVRGNYATLNPLYGGPIPTNGNLDVSLSDQTSYATISFTTGKWYWELTATAAITGGYVGVMDSTYVKGGNDWTSQARVYVANGNKYNGNTSAYGASWANGDVIGFAVDMDAGTIVFYKNGASQGTAFSDLSGKEWRPLIFATAGSYTINFGQRPFAYTAPSGFKALCTQNLPAPLVTKSNTVMDVALWTGNNSSPRSITGLEFNPDFVWIKERSAGSYYHRLFDAVRGTSNSLYLPGTEAENTYSSGYANVSSFDSSGFTLTNTNGGNNSGVTYVGWAWDAGTSTVSNTQGSITGGSQVRANPSSGFSVVTYTGNGVNGATVGHGLGVAPEMIIVKQRGSTITDQGWRVYHKSLGNTQYLKLNATDPAYTYGDWNNTTPTSSVFTIGTPGVATVNGNGATYVAYAWAPLVGYSSFGSYTGNGSTDGPFVFTGHRSRWILIKRTDAADDWNIFDTARSTYNVMGHDLLANRSDAEYTGTYIDCLSNGFKIRETNSSRNASGGTYIYAAFAEAPFQYARAR
jgi:hypothetical protein